MTQTYAQLQKQIASLEAQARKAKSAETDAVIGRMKEAIAVYGITAADLFGAKSAKAARSKGSKGARRGAAKYADGDGNTWIGMGKRPQWLRDALAAGKSLQDFAVDGAAKPKSNGAAASGTKAGAHKRRKGAGKTKYKDDAGHRWSGFGPQPRWLKDAVAGGRDIEEFRA
jgi:DNA-binding protein H-NS